MRHELGGRKTPQKLIEFAQNFWLACHRDLRAARIGLAQKSAGVKQLVGDIEMKWNFSHARFLEAGGVFFAGLGTLGTLSSLGNFGVDLAELLVTT